MGEAPHAAYRYVEKEFMLLAEQDRSGPLAATEVSRGKVQATICVWSELPVSPSILTARTPESSANSPADAGYGLGPAWTGLARMRTAARCPIRNGYGSGSMRTLPARSVTWFPADPLSRALAPRCCPSSEDIHTIPVLGSYLHSLRGVNVSLPGPGIGPGLHMPHLNQTCVGVSQDHEHHLIPLTPERDHHAIEGAQPQLVPSRRATSGFCRV
jgi:hypothetical protein